MTAETDAGLSNDFRHIPLKGGTGFDDSLTKSSLTKWHAHFRSFLPSLANHELMRHRPAAARRDVLRGSQFCRFRYTSGFHKMAPEQFLRASSPAPASARGCQWRKTSAAAASASVMVASVVAARAAAVSAAAAVCAPPPIPPDSDDRFSAGDLFSSPEVGAVLKRVDDTFSRKPLSGAVSDVQWEHVKASVTSMGFFDRLEVRLLTQCRALAVLASQLISLSRTLADVRAAAGESWGQDCAVYGGRR